MKRSFLHKIQWLLIILVGLCFKTKAQSATTLSGTQDLGGQTEYAQYLYIGPGAVISLSSDWVISSQYIFIDPSAQILGPGRMIIDNPAKFGPAAETAPWAGQPTTIDGGNARIDAPVLVRNPNNVVLGAVPVAQSGGDITTPNTDHTLYIGTNLDFATTNGDGTAITNNDVVIGNNDLKIASAATITHYDANSFVVTNGTGYLYKEPYTGTFVYPVGITDLDYTPASVNNTSGSNGLHVSVANYAGAPAGSITAPQEGIDRVWHIWGDNNTTQADICLQHNLSTNGAAYNDATTFVTQYGNLPNNTGDNPSTWKWQSNTQGPGVTGTMMDPSGPVAGSSTRCRTYAAGLMTASATSNFGWFTKSSDPLSPLPVKLAAFDISVSNCQPKLYWKTGEETNLAYFEVQRSTNGSTAFTAVATGIAPKGPNSSYSFTDAGAPKGSLLYRLRIVDRNTGNETYSNIVSATVNCNNTTITVRPNPVRDIVTVNGLTPGSTVKLVDAIGQEVTVVTKVSSVLHLSMAKYARGTYVLQVINNNEIIRNIKLIKE